MSDITFKAGLSWPEGAAPINMNPTARSGFAVRTINQALREDDGLLDQLRKSKATDIVITADWSLSRAGQPLSDRDTPSPFSVFYTIDGMQIGHGLCEFPSIAENIWAAAKTVQKLREIKRYGGDAMARQAQTAFECLPPPDKTWWEILMIPRELDIEAIRAVARARKIAAHPDKHNQNHDLINEVIKALEDAETEKKAEAAQK